MNQTLIKRIRPSLKLPVMAGALLLLLTSAAFGHAKLIRSQPGATATLKEAPQKIELWFTEELEPNFSKITVTDKDGKPVTKGDASVAEGGKKLQVDLQELQSGTYTVDWSALSTDQHMTKGKFTFTVTLPQRSNVSDQQTGTQATHEPSPQTQGTASSEPMPQMDMGTDHEAGSMWAHSVVRWIEYVSMIALFGGFSLFLLVLTPAIRESLMSDEERDVILNKSWSRLVRLSWIALFALACYSLVALVLQASMLTGVSTVEALSPSLLYRVLMTTGYGKGWILKTIAIIALAVLLLLIRSERNKAEHKSTLMWIALLVSAVLFIAPSLSGHAAAAEKDFSLSIASDWLHLLAAGLWIGGLFHLALTLGSSMSGLDGRARLRLLTGVIPRFTRYAIASVLLIVLTGLYNSWIHMEAVSDLWTTPYGKTLLVKVLLVLPILALGGLNTFVLEPRAKRQLKEFTEQGGTETHSVDRSFQRSVALEALLALLVLMVAAVLVFKQPTRMHISGMGNSVETAGRRMPDRY